LVVAVVTVPAAVAAAVKSIAAPAAIATRQNARQILRSVYATKTTKSLSHLLSLLQRFLVSACSAFAKGLKMGKPFIEFWREEGSVSMVSPASKFATVCRVFRPIVPSCFAPPSF